MPYSNMTNNYQISRYIVDIDGTTPFATIQSAINQTVTDGITSATILIRPGTYTENLVLVSGINLLGSQEGEVIIDGLHTPPAAGSILLSNLKLTSATDILFDAAAGTCNIKFYDCVFNCTLGFAANLALWTGDIVIESCGDISASNGIIFNNGAAAVDILDSTIGSGVVGMRLSGPTIVRNCRINCVIEFTGNANGLLTDSNFGGTITIGDPSIVKIFNSYITVGAVACVEDNSNQVIQLGNVVLDSSGADALTGVGTNLELGEVVFMNVASYAGTLTVIRTNECAAGNLRAYGNIDLPATEDTGFGGIINLDGDRFINSMGTNNTFVGTIAGNLLLTVANATDSTGVGYNSLNNQTSGGFNTGLGSDSLNHVTTGQKNLGLGFEAGSTITTGSSNILIANTGSAAAESNTIRIGVDGAGVGQQDSNYQAGIYQATSGATKEVVYIDSNFKLSSSNLGITQWIEANADLTAAVNTGYVVNITIPGLLTITLPVTSILGDIIEIAGLTAGMWSIAQNALQVIHFSGVDTTVGVGGSLSATTRYDTIKLLCVVANTEWVVLSSSGVFNLV